MKRRLSIVVVLVLTALGCSPSVSVPGVTVHIPDVAPVIAPGAPGVHVFYSELESSQLLAEFDRAVREVHPRYGLSSTHLQYGSNNLSRFRTRRLSNGRTMLLLYPFNFETERQGQPAVAAFEASGVLTESGLPTLEPVAVDFGVVNSAGEIFRFYAESNRSEVMSQARSCQNDYVFDRNESDTGGMTIDATEMPDSRVRFYVDVYHSSEDLAGLRQLQEQVGLLLACLDTRIGPGKQA